MSRDVNRIFRKFVAGVALGLPAIIAACQADSSLPERLLGLSGGDTAKISPMPIGAPLREVVADLNLCDAGQSTYGSGGLLVRHDVERSSVELDYAPIDTQISEYRLMSFNADGRQAQDVTCILKRGAAAHSFVRNFFKSRVTSPGLGGTFAFEIVPGAVCYYVGQAHEEVECDGTSCNIHQSRPIFSANSNAQGEAVVGGTLSSALGDVYYCAGGGTLYDRGNGTAFYNPNGGPPPDDPNAPANSGGGCAGNGTAAAPGDTNADGTPKLDQMRRLFANNCTVVPEPPDSGTEAGMCYWFHACKRPLNPVDLVVMDSAMKLVKRLTNLHKDSICQRALTKLTTLVLTGHVFRGESDMDWFEKLISEIDGHGAQTAFGGGWFHVDPGYLVVASPRQYAILGQMMMHEAMHVSIGFTVGGHGGTIVNHQYSNEPWSLFNYGTGAAITSGCIDVPAG